MNHLLIPRAKIYHDDSTLIVEYQSTDKRTLRAHFVLQNGDAAVFNGLRTLGDEPVKIEDAVLDDLPRGLIRALGPIMGRTIYTQPDNESDDEGDARVAWGVE